MTSSKTSARPTRSKRQAQTEPAPVIPKFRHVAIECEGGKYRIVTERLRMILGVRLERGGEPLPKLPHQNLDAETAFKNAATFDDWLEKQSNAQKNTRK